MTATYNKHKATLLTSAALQELLLKVYTDRIHPTSSHFHEKKVLKQSSLKKTSFNLNLIFL